MILERLEELLKDMGLHGPAGPALVDDPPSKLLLSSQVLQVSQVADSNTVKDGFLFLFSDILIIAKPVTQDYDALLDTNKPLPLDQKFIVVQPRDVRFTADRDNLPLSSFGSISRNPLVRTFVVQFAKDEDSAIRCNISRLRDIWHAQRPDGARSAVVQDARPGQGNARRLFVSENVESDAKSVHWVLRIRWKRRFVW